MAAEMPGKKQRELFFTMARQLTMLADYAEMALRENGRSDVFWVKKPTSHFQAKESRAQW